MYKLSGTTVVTAGLGALALFHVAWSWNTKPAEPWPRQIMSSTSAALDIGTAFQLHSGAWRAWPAAAEEAPVAPPAVVPAPEPPTSIPQASPVSVQSVPIQPIARLPGPPTPPPQEHATGQAEPSAPPADKATAAPSRPPADGRMSLSGPPAETATLPAVHAVRAAPAQRSAPRGPEHNPGLDTNSPSAAPPSPAPFGPGAFKQLERNGF